jgi:AraC family transcriptional regulator, mar-sox-rob regulon activator
MTLSETGGIMNLYQHVLNDLIRWLDTDRQVFPSATEVINRSGYSRWDFQRQFHKRTGMTLALFLKQRKLECIRDELLNENIEIISICEKYGYENPQTFCRMFRRYFGISPQQCRDKLGYKTNAAQSGKQQKIDNRSHG